MNVTATTPSSSSSSSSSSDTLPKEPIAAGPTTASALIKRTFSRTPSSWDPQDDLLLRHLKEQQKLGWKEISSHFSHRTPNACQFRWRRLKSGILKHSTAVNTLPTSSSPITSSKLTSSSPIGGLSAIKATGTRFSALTNGLNDQSKPDLVASGSTGNESYIQPPNYTQWSFTSSPAALTQAGNTFVGHNNLSGSHYNNNNKNNTSGHNSPTGNDTLSNSISSLTSLDSTASIGSSSSLPTPYTSFSLPQQHHHQSLYSHHHQQPWYYNSRESHTEPWTTQEDDLLLSKKGKQLSLIELSILMPYRSEEEISARMKTLEENIKGKEKGIDRDKRSRRSSVFSNSTALPDDRERRNSILSSVSTPISIPIGRESRLNSISSHHPPHHGSIGQGFGMPHTLSRTLSVSSEVSLVSNASSNMSFINSGINHENITGSVISSSVSFARHEPSVASSPIIGAPSHAPLSSAAINETIKDDTKNHNVL
ncbi:Dot6 protein [Saccharomycopsis crataegensis]|uniref:Dot6 protein n=1 Tax=Saccharomycopsis crataegensis TaxID=43959 RepID=A0AAV5QF01_9ASCO|nr:Dot6 protein [Saccharomycopsis crataegensis]